MPVGPDDFRRALARWASGVTIVTSRHGERRHGMTVSSFASVSLEPPLVLVCADRTSDTYAVIANAGVFAVNILAEGQEQLSARFASTREEHRRFEGLRCATALTGAPILPGSIVSLDCTLVGTHQAGDHAIYVGQVEAIADASDGTPLIYYCGAYRALR